MTNAPTNAKQDKVRINEQIKVPQVRLIDDMGEQVGIVSIDRAREIASESGLDLVEVAPQGTPPVCRIMDYGKYKYQQAKKVHEAKKKQVQTLVKEVKFRPKIEEHDYSFKLKNITRFLEEHNRVKVTIQFRGREIAYADTGRKLLDRVAQEAVEYGTVEGTPKLEGRTLIMILAPK